MDYNLKIQKEITSFTQVENVHELPAIFHYMSNKYWKPKLNLLGFDDIFDFFTKHIEKFCINKGRCRILSIGAGNCDLEIGF